MLTKVCTKCGIEKTVDCFSLQKLGRYGVTSACRGCVKEWKKTYYTANKKFVAEQRNAYQKANPHMFNANTAKRRATKLRATPLWVDKQHVESLYLIAAINRQGGYDLHVDHIVPLRSNKVCGLHCEANLQLLPASDNTSKGNRWWPDMW